MPVTAKFSHHFYQQFGDAATNELVDWLNAVDATYQVQIERVSELHFARFSAEMRARFAEQDAKFERMFAEQDMKFERKFAELDAKYERRFSELHTEIARVEARLAWQMMGTLATLVGVIIMLGQQFLHH